MAVLPKIFETLALAANAVYKFISLSDTDHLANIMIDQESSTVALIDFDKETFFYIPSTAEGIDSSKSYYDFKTYLSFLQEKKIVWREASASNHLEGKPTKGFFFFNCLSPYVPIKLKSCFYHCLVPELQRYMKECSDNYGFAYGFKFTIPKTLTCFSEQRYNSGMPPYCADDSIRDWGSFVNLVKKYCREISIFLIGISQNFGWSKMKDGAILRSVFFLILHLFIKR